MLGSAPAKWVVTAPSDVLCKQWFFATQSALGQDPQHSHWLYGSALLGASQVPSSPLLIIETGHGRKYTSSTRSDVTVLLVSLV